MEEPFPLSLFVFQHMFFLNQHKDTLVGGLEHFLFFHILGISSSQLTFTPSFFRGGRAQPPPDHY